MIDLDGDDAPLTPDEQVLLDLQFQLDEAFRQDPSIGTMNRVFGKLRTGRPEIDDELRDYIGLLYRFEEARPTLLAERRANLGTAISRSVIVATTLDDPPEQQ